MKSFIALFAILFSMNAFALKSVDCTVYDADGDDILNIDEYPTMSIDGKALEATLGAATYTQADGCVINQHKSRNNLITTVYSAGGEESFIVKVNLRTKKGVVLHQPENEEQSSELAKLKNCKVK